MHESFNNINNKLTFIFYSFQSLIEQIEQRAEKIPE